MTNPERADGRPPTSSAQPPAPLGMAGAGGTVTSGPAGGAGPLVITVIHTLAHPAQLPWLRKWTDG